ncbi:MAG: hypothetical protein IKF71_01570 [Bacilli bacterium]|nr:hypothetical protein [Bacilli bacterium]
MREEIEKIISDELDKVQPSLENIYEPIEEEINQKVEDHNHQLEKELVDVMESNSEDKDVKE